MSEFAPTPLEPVVSVTSLEAVDIRLRTIREVGDVPDSNRFLARSESFGDQMRTILAGMKEERTDHNSRGVERDSGGGASHRSLLSSLHPVERSQGHRPAPDV